jgi:hypothetical protein
MINRKLAMSGMSILTALTMMGGSAFAAFTATATTVGNTFSTSNPNLNVSTDGTTFGPTKPGFNVSGLVPGTTTAAQSFTLQNTGTDNMPVSAKFNYDTALNSLPGSDIDFTITCVGSNPVTHSYADWIATGDVIGTVNAGQNLGCQMTATLHAGVGNEDLNKKAVFDAVFSGSVGS